MARAFVCPGQGVQSIGMGKALADTFAESKAVFQEVDDALGERLSTLISVSYTHLTLPTTTSV